MPTVVYSLFCFPADSTVYTERLACNHLLCEHNRSVVFFRQSIRAPCTGIQPRRPGGEVPPNLNISSPKYLVLTNAILAGTILQYAW